MGLIREHRALVAHYADVLSSRGGPLLPCTVTMSGEHNRGPGRPRTFDEAKLFDCALGLFWQKGYDAVSVKEIARESGVTRGSLENAYGTKQAMFERALDVYVSRHPSMVLVDLDEDERIGPALFAFFDAYARFLAVEHEPLGCMSVNCTAALIARDGPEGDHIRGFSAQRDAFFTALVERAIEQGELPPPTDAKMLAGLVQVFVFGLSTYSQTGADVAQLEAMSHRFLVSVGFEEPAPEAPPPGRSDQRA